MSSLDTALDFSRPPRVEDMHLADFITFRAPRVLASGLTRRALVEGTDRAVLIRRLLRAGAAAEGIDLSTC